MNFEEKYKLLERLPGDGIESYRAKLTRSGREVTAHVLPGGKSAEGTKSLMARLLKLPAQSAAKLLEVGEYQGRSFVVISAPPFLHFNDWLAAEEGGVTPPPQTPPRATKEFTAPVTPERPAPPADEASRMFGQSSRSDGHPQPALSTEPGEFTRFFQTIPASPSPAPPPTTPQIPPTAPQPGEFTQMFQSAPQAAPSAPPPTPSPASEPGEFTRIFQSTPPAAPAAPPPTPPPASGPGEFTRMFQAGAPSGPLPESMVKPQGGTLGAPPPSPWGAPVAPGAGPGEFTRMFQSAPPPSPGMGGPSAPATPPPPPKPEGEFTRMFGAPQAVPTPPSPPALPSAPSPYAAMAAAAVPQPAFTSPAVPQMPQMPVYTPPAMPQMAAPAIPAPPSAAAAAPAQTSNILPMAIVGLLGFLLGVVVTYLLMRR